jgi:hypothetical protein
MSLSETETYALPSLGARGGAGGWASRRAELLDAFAANVYGRTPEGGGVGGVETLTRVEGALGGAARMTEYEVTLAGPLGSRAVALLVHVPLAAGAPDPAPVLLGYNFMGNHATTHDPTVRVSDLPVYMPAVDTSRPVAYPLDPSDLPAIVGYNPMPAGGRGSEAGNFLGAAIARGYAVATLHFAEIEVDRPDAAAAAAGVRGMFATEEELDRARDPEAWGTLAAWAFGLSRMLDALEVVDGADTSATLVHGISRYGKVALWAAAQDERIAGALTGVSGCGGAALFRNKSGENARAITHFFPNWFARRFDDDVDGEGRLPVDQHQLLALIAPRALYVASAAEDSWADPRNEFLATVHASPVFELFGDRGTLPPGTVAPGGDVPVDVARDVTPPAIGARVGGRLSYHIRQGDHGVTDEDWGLFLGFADEQVVHAPSGETPGEDGHTLRP